MGMIGYFAEIDSEKINQLLESTEKPLMDNIHDTLSGLRRLDIDKRWDFLTTSKLKHLSHIFINLNRLTYLFWMLSFLCSKSVNLENCFATHIKNSIYSFCCLMNTIFTF